MNFKTKALITIMTLACSAVNAFAADEADKKQCLQEAERCFTQANGLIDSSPSEAMELYNKSILNYKRLIDEFKIQNEHIYYNIANAWLMQGNIGKAILNYRRAEELDGSSTDINGNLNYARSLRADQIPIPVEKKVLETLFFWHYDFSLAGRFYGAVFFWWLSAAMIAMMVITKKKPLPAIAVCCVFIFCTLCLGGSVAYQMQHGKTDNFGVITSETAVARQGDGENYPESFAEPLHSGTEFKLLENRGSWYKIELGNGDTTWVDDGDAEII